ncbi:MAG: hypothetical protein ACTSP3_00330 [Candidatus Heimdallarchaeaceae archaeon]
MQLIKEPHCFGNFQIYNKVLHQEHITLLSELYEIILQAATMTYKNLLSFIIFKILKDISRKKLIECFFSELTNIFLERLKLSFERKSMVILSDEMSNFIEFKSADWFTSSASDKELSKKIAKKLHQSPIIIGGIDE